MDDRQTAVFFPFRVEHKVLACVVVVVGFVVLDATQVVCMALLLLFLRCLFFRTLRSRIFMLDWPLSLNAERAQAADQHPPCVVCFVCLRQFRFVVG